MTFVTSFLKFFYFVKSLIILCLLVDLVKHCNLTDLHCMDVLLLVCNSVHLVLSIFEHSQHSVLPIQGQIYDMLYQIEPYAPISSFFYCQFNTLPLSPSP